MHWRIWRLSCCTGKARADRSGTDWAAGVGFWNAVVSATFTVSEAAEYLEVSVPTFRRYVQAKKIIPDQVGGRNQFLQRKT
ncbi:helix-turn-helix domain-containing protein [Azonexus sp.]|uniref:helix-turn-helix domain-containing protein n=1 Tax=Azonexus sp. TaxID=1872668 RepID=UPI0035A044FA